MIKRYDLINVPCHGGWDSYDELQEVEDGGWVRYDDHAAEVERLRAELHRVALPVLLAELRTLRARVAELERDLDVCRVELDAARADVGEAWFAGGVTLAEAIRRKCRALEDDAEHWRKAAEARALRVEEGDHALHRFAALAAAKNEGRSAITLTVWSDGTVDAEQYATLEGELDEWSTLHQERRASWGSRPIGELDALVDDLESDDWHTVEHRAPQDFWREIQALRARVAELERDARLGARVRKAVKRAHAHFGSTHDRIIAAAVINHLAEEGGK